MKDSANKNQLLIDPKAAEVVRRIFQMALDGFNTVQIARSLNDDLIPTPMLYKRTRNTVGDWHTVKVRHSEWITVADTHEGIVTREEFDKVQTLLQSRAERDIRPQDASPLCKKVRCGVSGHIMVRNKAKACYYICRTPRMTSAYSCTVERVPESDLMEALLNGLRTQALYAVEAGRIWEEQHRQYRRDTDTESTVGSERNALPDRKLYPGAL